MVELRSLGSIDLRSEGTEIAAILTQPKRLALLLYLDIARPYGFHRRDRLTSMLWPELDESHAGDALDHVLEHLRREIGENAIVTREDEVMLDQSFIRSDVRVLDEALSSENHLRAVHLYEGPFAEGFVLTSAPAFEDWLSDERNRLRTAVAASAWAIAEQSKEAGRVDEASMYARSATILSREDETAIRRLMEFLDSMGDRAGALRAYDQFQAWLGAELDVEVSGRTTAVRDAIRDGEAIDFSTPAAPAAKTAAPSRMPRLRAVLTLLLHRA